MHDRGHQQGTAEPRFLVDEVGYEQIGVEGAEKRVICLEIKRYNPSSEVVWDLDVRPESDVCILQSGIAVSARL